MARDLSLRQRIFRWSVGSVLAILLAVFFFVDQSLRSTIRAGLEENVEAGARLAGELERSSVEAGVERVASLAAAPTIRAAVETGDPATVRQSLEQVFDPTQTAWLAVASPDGAVIAFVGNAPVRQIEEARLLMEEARSFDTGDLWRVGDRLLQVHVGGLFFGPNPLGFLFMGEAIDDPHIQRLAVSTQQDVAVVAGGRLVAGGAGFSEADREAFAAAWASVPSGGSPGAPERLGAEDRRVVPGSDVREFALAEGPHLGAAIPLQGAAGQRVGSLVAFRSLSEAMAPARTLRLTLLTIAVAGIVLALGFSWVLSGGVTRPIDRLLRETVRLGSGDLEHPVEPEREDEIGRLAQGFEKMRISLASAQRDLIRAERLSAVGRAASRIVHDFRQPVTVIQASVDLLEKDLGNPVAQREDVQAIRSEIERLTFMMQEILDFARGEDRIEMRSGSVRELLDGLARRYRAQLDARHIRLAVEHGYEGDWVLDFVRTGRTIENLVQNGAAAVDSGGAIRIRSAVSNATLRIEVEDDGPGIPEALRESLFEPFVTTGKRGGTGLGLAIARAFTERQGGTIRYSTSEAGTTLVLEFPRPAEDA